MKIGCGRVAEDWSQCVTCFKPVDDEACQEGYSLDRLRELSLVDLDTEHSRNGSHLNQSLTALFELVNASHHHKQAEQQLFVDHTNVADRSEELYLQLPGLDAQLLDAKSTELLDGVTLRSEALQQVLRTLILSTGKRKSDSAGFISYAQLGINQLGAVYEW